MISGKGEWEGGETGGRVGTIGRNLRKIHNLAQPLLPEFVLHFQWSDNCSHSA